MSELVPFYQSFQQSVQQEPEESKSDEYKVHLPTKVNLRKDLHSNFLALRSITEPRITFDKRKGYLSVGSKYRHSKDSSIWLLGHGELASLPLEAAVESATAFLRALEDSEHLHGMRFPPWVSASNVSQKLRFYIKNSDLLSIGMLANDLLTNKYSKTELQEWIAQEGQLWLKEKRRALAAVIEAAAMKKTEGLVSFIADVLEYREADMHTALVAAQRVRLFRSMEAGLRSRICASLCHWIEIWEANSATENYVSLALPSVPFIAGSDSVPWLVRRISKGNEYTIWGIANGILSWTTKTTESQGHLSRADTDVLFESLASRWRLEIEKPRAADSNGPGMLAGLVWALGATANAVNLETVSSIIAASFKNPRNLEDAASVRAARLLVKKHRRHAWLCLGRAFGDMGAEFARFLELVTEQST